MSYATSDLICDNKEDARWFCYIEQLPDGTKKVYYPMAELEQAERNLELCRWALWLVRREHIWRYFPQDVRDQIESVIKEVSNCHA